MLEFKPLTPEEIAALTPEALEAYNTELAAYEVELAANKSKTDEDLSDLKFTEISDIAKERGYTFPANIGKDKLLELMKSPPVVLAKEKIEADKKAKEEAKAEKKESKTIKGFETSDGYQFPVKNDAENHARSLPEGEREIEECTIKLA